MNGSPGIQRGEPVGAKQQAGVCFLDGRELSSSPDTSSRHDPLFPRIMGSSIVTAADPVTKSEKPRAATAFDASMTLSIHLLTRVSLATSSGSMRWMGSSGATYARTFLAVDEPEPTTDHNERAISGFSAERYDTKRSPSCHS
jgi:hypothetical protein